MTIFLTIVHVFVCFVLIAVILLQAGRGGGLSDMASGQPQAILGTQTNTFMTRATEVCAVLFIVTSISLGILSTQRSKSLVDKTKLSRAVQGAVSQAVAPKKEVALPVKEAAKAAEAEKVAPVEAPVVATTTSTAAETKPAS